MLNTSIHWILSCLISDHLCDVDDPHGGQVDYLRVAHAKGAIFIVANANLIRICSFV